MFDGNVNEHALCFRHDRVEFWQEQFSAVAAVDSGLCKLIYHCACFHLL